MRLMKDALRLLTLGGLVLPIVLIGPRLHASEPTQTADAPASFSAAERDARGVSSHAVRSNRQAGPTKLRMLTPKSLAAGQRVPVIYLLPVEARDESRYGNALEEIERSGLSEQHAVIFAAPTFWHLPWYADHPTDRTLAQERYLVEDILPFVERNYPAQAEPQGRLLLGFSKSGWGAWSLLLRHPDLFGRAAAWDAPFQLSKPGPYGSGPIFGTPENFARYDVKRLLTRLERPLGADHRLILLGYDAFRAEHVALHAQLEQLHIAHEYRDGPRRAHHWHSGWVAEAVELLLAPKVTAQ